MERELVALAGDLGWKACCQAVGLAREGEARVPGVAAQAGQSVRKSLRYLFFFLSSQSLPSSEERCGHQEENSSARFIYGRGSSDQREDHRGYSPLSLTFPSYRCANLSG